jgi:hypothetical protein
LNSFRNFLLALLALAVVAEGVLAWRQYQELIVLRAGAANDTGPALVKSLAEAQRRIKALQDQVASSRRARVASDVPGARSEGRPDFRAGFRQAMNNPEFVKLMAIETKSGLDAKYAGLFKSLSQTFNLSPEQMEQFKNLLVQKQQSVMDALQAARDQGLNPRTDPQGFNEAVTAAQASMDSQIQAALGPAAFAQYQTYEQTLPQRNTVNQVQQSLSYSATPLTDDQAAQLVQILAQDAPQSANGASNIRNLLNPNPTSPVTAQALADAASVLAPAQVQALQQLMLAQNARQQMQQLLRGGGGQTPSPPTP